MTPITRIPASTRRWILSLICGLMVLGCGGGGGSGGAPDLGPDSGPEVEPDLGKDAYARHPNTSDGGDSPGLRDAGPEPVRSMRDLLVDIVRRRCEQAARCCETAAYAFDESLCLEHGGNLTLGALESEAANAADFERAAADLCLAWYAGPGQACEAAMPVECFETLQGRQGPDELCTWAPECADGDGFAHCADQNAVGLGRCVQFTRGAIGDPCEWTCENTGDECSRQIDPEHPDEVSGHFCSRADGLTCAYDTRECVAIPVEGDDCSVRSCAPGFSCDLDTTRCRRLPAVGDPCPDRDCDAAVCVDGVCVPPPGPGEACDPEAWSSCGPDAECLPDGRCGPVLSSLVRAVCRAYSHGRP